MRTKGVHRRIQGFRHAAVLAAILLLASTVAFGQRGLGRPLPPPRPSNTQPIPPLIQQTIVPMFYPVPNQGVINTGASSLIQTVPVVPGVFLLAGAGANTLVQVGNDGVLVVDSKYEEVAIRLDDEIRSLSDKPIVWLINTSLSEDHIAGNRVLIRLGARDLQQLPHVVAHQNLLNRLRSASSRALEAATIQEPYSGASKDFTFNGERVSIYSAPAATTDGDSIVCLHNANVLATGDIFTPNRYPIIDTANGGSVQGVIQALNHILELTAAGKSSGSAVRVIPGHGRVSDEREVTEYRDMVIIIRDRVQDAIRKGLTLRQLVTSGMTRDYDTVYGSTTGTWTTDRFVEAVYNSLKAEPSTSTAR